MKKLLFAVCICILSASTSQADIVATFNFDGGSLDATTQPIGMSSAIVLGSDYSIDSDAGTIFNEATGFGNDTGNAQQQALFTYTVSGLADNQTLTLDDLTLTVAETGGANSFRIQAYANGATASGNFDPPADDIVVLTFTENTTNYTDLVNGASFTVGFGARDGSNPPSRVDYDNLVLNGTINTVAVPEPTSSAVLLVGLGLTTLVRRRRS